MKKLVFTLFVFILTLPSFSQQKTLPIFINFDKFHGTNLSSAYTGWQEAQGGISMFNIQNSNWISSYKLFEKSAGINLYGAGKNNWIISPIFKAENNCNVSFRAALTRFLNDPERGFLGYDDSISVLVISQNKQKIETIFSFNYQNQPNEQLNFYQVSLKKWSGQNIQIAFYTTTGNTETGYCSFHLDDILIFDKKNHDIALQQVNTPNFNTYINQETPLNITIYNNGNNFIEALPIKIRVRGKKTENHYKIVEVKLKPNKSKMFNINNLDLSEKGEYEISIINELKNDSIHYNDTLKFKINYNQKQSLPLQELIFDNLQNNYISDFYKGWFEAKGKNYPKTFNHSSWKIDSLKTEPKTKTFSVDFRNVKTDEWLISPVFVAENNTKLKLQSAIEFEAGYTQMGSDDKLSIMLSKDFGTTWAEIFILDNENNLIENLKDFEVDLSNYAEEKIKLAFYATTSNIANYEKYKIHLKNINIRNFHTNDLALTKINLTENPCAWSENETVSITLKNTGTNIISNFSAYYKLNDEIIVKENINQEILQNETLKFIFENQVNFTKQDKNILKVWISSENENNFENDTLIIYPKVQGINLSEKEYYTSFEEEDLNWTIENLNNDLSQWTLKENAEFAKKGQFSFEYNSRNTTQKSNDYLFSPCLYLKKNLNYKISFSYLNRSENFPESLQIRIGKEAIADSMQTILLNIPEINTINYQDKSIDFQVEETGKYYISFYANGEPSRFAIHIDNVKISQVIPNNIALKELYFSRKKSQNCHFISVDTLKIKVKNEGSNTLNNIPIYLKISNQDTILKIFNKEIKPNETKTFSFFENINLNDNKTYKIKIWSSINEDNIKGNDTIKIDNFSPINYKNSFEKNTEKLITQNIAGTNTWHILNKPSIAHSGKSVYAIRTDFENGNTTNNDWLFTDCFYLEKGKCYDISFFYRSHYSTENLAFYIGKSPNPENMNLILDFPEINSNSYQKAEHNFSVAENGIYYFAWQVKGGVQQKYYTYIDDLELKVSNNSASAEITYTQFDNEFIFSANTKNIEEHFWDFGDGKTSTKATPTHTYKENGKYNIAYTGIGTCGSIQREKKVEINCEIDCDFTYTINGINVNFSTENKGLAYEWSFGDGNFSSLKNPQHTYCPNGEETYEIQLKIFKNCGEKTCKKTITVKNEIAFNYTINATTVNFSTSTIADSYFWDFGDGNTSTNKNPEHIYHPQGTTNYKIIFETQQGDKTSHLEQNLTIDCQVEPNFTYETEGNLINFFTKNKANSYLWDFGDETSSNVKNPVHNYQINISQNYLVELSLNTACGLFSIEKQVSTQCQEPEIDFEINDNIVTFDTEIEAKNYIWNFGDGTSSFEKNPIHTYILENEEEVFNIELSTLTKCGLKTTQKSIKINCENPVNFTFEKQGESVQFFTNTIGNSYLWNFGDNLLSQEKEPLHKYQIFSNTKFNIKLSVNTSCGLFSKEKDLIFNNFNTNDFINEKVKIYPNPASDFLTIESNEKTIFFEIFDLSGKKIDQRKIIFFSKKGNIDISNLKQGLYYIKIKNKNLNINKLFIKK